MIIIAIGAVQLFWTLTSLGAYISYSIVGRNMLPLILSASLWSVLSVVVLKRFHNRQWFWPVMVITAPITYALATTIIFTCVMLPADAALSGNGLSGSVYWYAAVKQVTTASFITVYWKSPTYAALLTVCIALATYVCRRRWGTFSAVTKARKPLKVADVKTGLVRVPGTNLMIAIFCACLINPAVVLIFLFVFSGSGDSKSLGFIISVFAVPILVFYIFVYVAFYLWVGRRVENVGIMLLKGYLLAVVAFPLAIHFSIFVLWTFGGAGDAKIQAPPYDMWNFIAVFAALPVLLSVLIAIGITRRLFYKPAGHFLVQEPMGIASGRPEA